MQKENDNVELLFQLAMVYLKFPFVNEERSIDYLNRILAIEKYNFEALVIKMYLQNFYYGEMDQDFEVITNYKWNDSYKMSIAYYVCLLLNLADTLWEKGRLTEEIKAIALEMIEEEKNTEIWESEKLRKEREHVLDKLKEKLNSKMPERKKVPIHNPYKLGWEEGQVYTFQIKEEIRIIEIGKYLTMKIVVWVIK